MQVILPQLRKVASIRGWVQRLFAEEPQVAGSSLSWSDLGHFDRAETFWAIRSVWLADLVDFEAMLCPSVDWAHRTVAPLGLGLRVDRPGWRTNGLVDSLEVFLELFSSAQGGRTQFGRK